MTAHSYALEVGGDESSVSAQSEPRAVSHRALTHVLVVAEDPYLIVEAQNTLGPLGVRVTGCLGPAQTPCILDQKAVCPLAAHASVAIVDTPAGGKFCHHWKSVSAGEYATRLARAHPRCLVILSGAPQGLSGFCGEVAHATNARSALDILRQVISVYRPAANASADLTAQKR